MKPVLGSMYVNAAVADCKMLICSVRWPAESATQQHMIRVLIWMFRGAVAVAVATKEVSRSERHRRSVAWAHNQHGPPGSRL